MKATFVIPDELYREFKAQTAREGRSVREVTIELLEKWLKQRKQSAPHPSPVDWLAFAPPLAGYVQDQVADQSMDAVRETIARQWNEPA